MGTKPMEWPNAVDTACLALAWVGGIPAPGKRSDPLLKPCLARVRSSKLAFIYCMLLRPWQRWQEDQSSPFCPVHLPVWVIIFSLGFKKKIPQPSELMKFLIRLRNCCTWGQVRQDSVLVAGEGRQRAAMLCCALFWVMPGTGIAAIFLRGTKVCPEPGFKSWVPN